MSKENGMANVKRNYKDGIFRALFNDKVALSDLYSALSGFEVTSEEIEIVTLKNAIFNGIKNDLAFIVGAKLIVLIEHQATDSPNLPLRMFCYLAEEYKRILAEKNVYGMGLIKIPAPELYVFYNGQNERDEEWILKLSDAFSCKVGTPSVEAIVKVININYDKGAELLKRCKTLEGYSILLHRVNELLEETGDIDFAMTNAIQQCIDQNIIADFLNENRRGVMDILNYTLTEEQKKEIYKAEGHAEGRAEGRAVERREMIFNMKEAGISIEQIIAASGWSREKIEDLT